jgi:hypothetical protein
MPFRDNARKPGSRAVCGESAIAARLNSRARVFSLLVAAMMSINRGSLEAHWRHNSQPLYSMDTICNRQTQSKQSGTDYGYELPLAASRSNEPESAEVLALGAASRRADFECRPSEVISRPGPARTEFGPFGSGRSPAASGSRRSSCRVPLTSLVACRPVRLAGRFSALLGTPEYWVLHGKGNEVHRVAGAAGFRACSCEHIPSSTTDNLPSVPHTIWAIVVFVLGRMLRNEF